MSAVIKKRPRVKAPAVDAPQSRTQTATEIKSLGDVLREIRRLEADMNDQIAVITKAFEPAIKAQQERAKLLQSRIQLWCEAHREELLEGEGKSANLITGEVGWRIGNRSVRIEGGEDGEFEAIEQLKGLGLGDLVRTIEQVNRAAILAEPDRIKGLACIKLVGGRESFWIKPFEQEAQ